MCEEEYCLLCGIMCSCKYLEKEEGNDPIDLGQPCNSVSKLLISCTPVILPNVGNDHKGVEPLSFLTTAHWTMITKVWNPIDPVNPCASLLLHTLSYLKVPFFNHYPMFSAPILIDAINDCGRRTFMIQLPAWLRYRTKSINLRNVFVVDKGIPKKTGLLVAYTTGWRDIFCSYFILHEARSSTAWLARMAA